jgi:hypothetical protein
MFKTSHLQELKRRYASIYAPPVEEEIEEHCGVCGEQGIEEDHDCEEVHPDQSHKKWEKEQKEEVEVAESFELQATMALDDAGVKSKWKKGKLYVAKRDIKKAEKALGKSFKKMKKGAEPDLYYEEVELDEKGTAYPATVDTLRKIVKDKQHQTVMFKSGKAMVDLFTASAMVQVYDALKKPEMKKHFEKMIADKAGFMKTQAFAMKMIG